MPSPMTWINQNKSPIFQRTFFQEPWSVLILVSLVGLRIFYLGGIRLFTRPDYPDWLLPSEMFLTYLLTASLIYLQRDRLVDFHITRVSLLLFICAPILEPLLSLLMHEWIQWPYSNLFRISVGIVAIVLSALIFFSRKDIKLSPDRFQWILLSLIFGVFMAFAYGFYIEFSDFGRIGVRDVILKPPATLSYAVVLLSAQLVNASIMEEPLFRGFLWGYLRKWGLTDIKILVVQTILFWMAHIYYLGQVAFSFWILVPTAGIIFGILAWRSRSIAPSIIAHAIVNGLTQIVSSRTFYFWW